MQVMVASNNLRILQAKTLGITNQHETEVHLRVNAEVLYTAALSMMIWTSLDHECRDWLMLEFLPINPDGPRPLPMIDVAFLDVVRHLALQQNGNQAGKDVRRRALSVLHRNWSHYEASMMCNRITPEPFYPWSCDLD